MPMMLLTGMGMMVQMAASNTVLQTIVDENKRGRVMSLFLMAFAGMMPFGSLFGGFVADRFGAPRNAGGRRRGVSHLAAVIFLRALPEITRELSLSRAGTVSAYSSFRAGSCRSFRSRQLPIASASISVPMKQPNASSGVQTIGSPRTLKLGVHEHGAAGLRLERREQRVKARIGSACTV